MSFPLKTILNVAPFAYAVLTDTVSDKQSGGVYVGYVIDADGSVFGNTWNMEGVSTQLSNNWDLKPVITSFGVGKWIINKRNDVVAVVTTMSPHESSSFRLIGFVVDARGRMVPERWTLKGRSGNGEYDLDGLADHTQLPF